MYVCPDGHGIRGTYEQMNGCALAEPVLEDGRIVPAFVGETEVFWDGQETVREFGEDVWMCENGDTFPAPALVVADD